MIKFECTKRIHYWIDAENKEEALAKFRQWAVQDLAEHDGPLDIEIVEVEENDG